MASGGEASVADRSGEVPKQTSLRPSPKVHGFFCCTWGVTASGRSAVSCDQVGPAAKLGPVPRDPMASRGLYAASYEANQLIAVLDRPAEPCRVLPLDQDQPFAGAMFSCARRAPKPQALKQVLARRRIGLRRLAPPLAHAVEGVGVGADVN